MSGGHASRNAYYPQVFSGKKQRREVHAWSIKRPLRSEPKDEPRCCHPENKIPTTFYYLNITPKDENRNTVDGVPSALALDDSAASTHSKVLPVLEVRHRSRTVILYLTAMTARAEIRFSICGVIWGRIVMSDANRGKSEDQRGLIYKGRPYM